MNEEDFTTYDLQELKLGIARTYQDLKEKNPKDEHLKYLSSVCTSSGVLELDKTFEKEFFKKFWPEKNMPDVPIDKKTLLRNSILTLENYHFALESIILDSNEWS